jgi:hypothetical protein
MAASLPGSPNTESGVDGATIARMHTGTEQRISRHDARMVASTSLRIIALLGIAHLGVHHDGALHRDSGGVLSAHVQLVKNDRCCGCHARCSDCSVEMQVRKTSGGSSSSTTTTTTHANDGVSVEQRDTHLVGALRFRHCVTLTGWNSLVNIAVGNMDVTRAGQSEWQ